MSFRYFTNFSLVLLYKLRFLQSVTGKILLSVRYLVGNYVAEGLSPLRAQAKILGNAVQSLADKHALSVENMKDSELKVISELIKNSRRSDRELARATAVSQPTITRIRRNLEKEGVIKEYTMIPDLVKLGVEIVAVTFGQWNWSNVRDPESAAFKETKQFIITHPSVIFCSSGLGLGKSTMVITVHKTYSDYDKFIEEARQKAVGLFINIESFIISLKTHTMPKPFTLSNLIEYLSSTSHDEKL